MAYSTVVPGGVQGHAGPTGPYPNLSSAPATPLAGLAPSLPSNITMGPNGAYISTTTPEELTSTNLAGLMQSSSPLEQLAQSQGMNAAAARGSANGTLFAGAEQAALNQNLAPIAAQDAQAQQATNQQNVSSLNQMANSKVQERATLGAAGIAANASMQNAQLAAQTQKSLQTQSLAQNQQQFSDNWKNQFQMATQSQGFQMASQQQQQEFTAKYNTLNTAFQTVMSDPDYWSNPQASMGMINYFTQNIDALLANMGIGGSAGSNPNIPNTAP